MAASLLLRHRKLLLCLPRQFGGKTEFGCRAAHDLLSNVDGISALFLAKSAPARKKATREKFMRIFEPETFSVNTEIIYHKRKPANQLLMGSVDKDPDGQRGGTYGYVHWSEVAFSKLEHGESITDVFLKVVKPTLSLLDGYGLLESTNNGKNGWYDIWESYKEFGFARLLVSFSQMLEMGLVSQEDYDKEKRETLPLIFRQEFDCEFVSFQGLIYEEFDPRRHIWENMPPPEHWQRVIMAIDWGYNPSATCVLFAYVHEGVVHIFDEIHEKEQLLDECYQAITERLNHWSIQHFAGTADHDLLRIEELNRRGIPCGKAQKANVMGNRIEVKEMLWKDRIKIHPRCKALLRDIETAVWHKKKEGELDYDQGGKDQGHYDGEAALRYLIRELKGYEHDEPEQNPHAALDQASAREWQLRRGGQEME